MHLSSPIALEELVLCPDAVSVRSMSNCFSSHWLQELHRRYKDGLPKLDPVADMGINSTVLASALADIRRMETALQNNVIGQVNPSAAASSEASNSTGDRYNERKRFFEIVVRSLMSTADGERGRWQEASPDPAQSMAARKSRGAQIANARLPAEYIQD